MAKPSTPAVWASGKTFGFQPSAAQQAQGFDYIATIRPSTGAPITDDHDWPLNQITTAMKWMMDQVDPSGLKTAAFRDVGTGPNQIPDMTSFTGNTGENGRFYLPSGHIVQYGRVPTVQPSGSVTFPVPFPVACYCVTGSRISTDAQSLTISFDASKSSFNYRATGAVSFFWLAIGV